MPSWKKIIVSGSDAHLNSVTASNGSIISGSTSVTGSVSVFTGTGGTGATTGYQHLGLQSQTKISGSFTGSFTGDGTNLTGVTATPTFPTTAKTDLASTDKFFINDDAGNGTVGNKQITYGNLLTDLAGTNLAVEGSDSLTLASSITGISNFQSTSITGSTITGSFTGSFGGTFTGAVVANNGVISGSSLSSPAQGQVTLTTNGVAQSATSITSLTTAGSPSFVDLTLSGDINVNGGDITTTAGTFNVATTNASTINIGSNTSTVVVGNNLSVQGNLSVLGNVTEIQVTNINVEDQFVLLASGSQGSPGADGGIIVVSGSAAGTGSALYHDITDQRWAVARSIAGSSTSITALEYVTTVSSSTADPSTVNYGVGEMHVNTNTGDIWIYS